MKAEYEADTSLTHQHMADKYGLSKDIVKRALRSVGTVSNQQMRGKSAKTWDADKAEALKAEYEKGGASLAKVAAGLGLGPQAARRAARSVDTDLQMGPRRKWTDADRASWQQDRDNGLSYQKIHERNPWVSPNTIRRALSTPRMPQESSGDATAVSC